MTDEFLSETEHHLYEARYYLPSWDGHTLLSRMLFYDDLKNVMRDVLSHASCDGALALTSPSFCLRIYRVLSDKHLALVTYWRKTAGWVPVSNKDDGYCDGLL